jgi:hypothetical protein
MIRAVIRVDLTSRSGVPFGKRTLDRGASSASGWACGLAVATWGLRQYGSFVIFRRIVAHWVKGLHAATRRGLLVGLGSPQARSCAGSGSEVGL